MKPRSSSRLEGFYELDVEQRREAIGRLVAGTAESLGISLDMATAEQMVENAVGVFGLPLGVALNFRINGRDVIIPMAIEEPSVIAGASNAARMARSAAGFIAEAAPPLTVVQVEIRNPQLGAAERILAAADEILDAADATQPELVSFGGGAQEMVVREEVGGPERLVVHIVVNCVDAMGANVVNTMAEAVSGRLAELAGGTPGLRILTNLADRRLARARCEVPFDALARRGFTGEEVAHGVQAAAQFAAADPYRAATHNKGIFNGIDAVLVATGNDWRAVEAGGHAYAARGGGYGPLSTWGIEGRLLVGEIELPMAVGIVGGASRAHPQARLAIELLGVETASELAGVVASVGLASNLAALAALATEGIQHGHMRLHRRKLKPS